MKLQSVRGTYDILPPESFIWEWIESKTRNLFNCFNYKEIKTPVFEVTELFNRTIGDCTDIVLKEMYTFQDKKGRSLTLRPEGTASVVRACLQHKLIQQNYINKLFYFGPMFRYERPQAGRQRQFHQTGIEIIGSSFPCADIEAILLLKAFFNELGLDDIKFRINTTGSRASRPMLNQALKEALEPNINNMCNDCILRFSRNVLRVYDCKVPSCKKIIQKLPAFAGILNADDQSHFDEVKAGLDALKIEYKVDPHLVRGLDYYTRTIFEVYTDKLGACDALAGGGRYDGLFEEMGSSEIIPAVGFAIGIERVINVLKNMKLLPSQPRHEIMVINFGGSAYLHSLKLTNRLRCSGYLVDFDLSGRSVKAQFRTAGREGFRFAIVMGEEEIIKQTVKLKDLFQQTEIELTEEQLVRFLHESIKK